MAAKRTIRVHDKPMPDFLADLNLQTGIRFFADKSVADDKVTVYAHDRPLGDTLRVIAAFFKFEWKRDGAAKDFGYILLQSPEYQAEQDRIRREKTAEAADTILAEVEAFDRYMRLSEGQLQARQSSIAKDLLEVSDPSHKKALLMENNVLAQLIARSDWRKLVNKFLKTLNRQQLIELMLAGVTDYAWPMVPGSKVIPEGVIKDFRSDNDFSILNLTPSMGESNYVRLRFSSDYRREPILRWQMTLGRRNIHGRRGMDFASSLPSTTIMLASSKSDPTEPSGWKSDPDLAAKVTFEVRPAVPPGKSVLDQPIPRPTLGNAMEALDRVHPIDAVADCFFSTRMQGCAFADKPVGEALIQMSFATNHKWLKQDGFIQFQSMSYDSDRRLEPPAGELARWTNRALAEGLGLDEYAEIASLNDGVLGTLMQMVAQGDFPDPLQPVSQARDHLKMWNGLSRLQRRKALADGLAFKDMGREQQLKMAQASMEPDARLKDAKFRVEFRQNRLWGVRTPGGASMSGIGSREEAFAQLQRADPGLKLQDVKQVLFSNVRFIYETGELMINQAYAQLPPVWQDGKSGEQP